MSRQNGMSKELQIVIVWTQRACRVFGNYHALLPKNNLTVGLILLKEILMFNGVAK